MKRKIIGITVPVALLLGIQCDPRATSHSVKGLMLAQTSAKLDSAIACTPCECDLDLEDLDLITDGVGSGSGLGDDGFGSVGTVSQNTQVLASL